MNGATTKSSDKDIIAHFTQLQLALESNGTPCSTAANHKLSTLRLAAAYSKPHHLHTLPRLTTRLDEGSGMTYTGLL